MNNSLSVSVAFSFKGENYALKTIVDLDDLVKKSVNLPDFYMVLAHQNQIDTYSYLYEVMMSSDLVYADATGIAVDCVEAGEFKFEKFEALWHEQQTIEYLKIIAKTHMNIDDLNEHVDLLATLLAAHKLGKNGAP